MSLTDTLPEPVHIRVTVELPASITDDGEAQRLCYALVLEPERFRMRGYREHLPHSMKESARRLMRDMQWNC